MSTNIHAMPSTKSKVEEFLRRYPYHKTFLNNLIKKDEHKMNEELEEDNKEEIVEKAKNFFEFDIEDLKKSFSDGFKYKLEFLNNDNSDYKVIQSSIKSIGKSLDNVSDRLSSSNSDKKENTEVSRIFRVIPNNKALIKSKTSSCSKVLLLHGTKAPNVEGILKTGFKPSQKGLYGPGVYLTDSLNYACGYGECFAQDKGIVKKYRYVFVNKVERTYELSPTNFDGCEFKNVISFEEYLQKKPVVQLWNACSMESGHFEDSSHSKYDSNNVEILQGTFERNYLNERIILAHHDLVVPAYLIEIEEKQSAEKTVKEIVEFSLYYNLKLTKFIESLNPVATYQKKSTEHNTSNKAADCSLDIVTKALEKEINRNRQVKFETLMSRHETYIKSIIKQLPFEISSIIKTKDLGNIKHTAELLKAENDDYKFILRSIENDKNSITNRQILHVFKINSVDKSEEAKLKGECLFLMALSRTK